MVLGSPFPGSLARSTSFEGQAEEGSNFLCTTDLPSSFSSRRKSGWRVWEVSTCRSLGPGAPGPPTLRQCLETPQACFMSGSLSSGHLPGGRGSRDRKGHCVSQAVRDSPGLGGEGMKQLSAD